jgi:citrate lyase subunit beta/citryl-CoA lyase
MSGETEDGAATAAARGLSPWPRAWLFTPADDARKLDAAARSGAGAVIADLEDSVAPERKQLAREGALGFLQRGAGARPPLRIVRVNDPRSEQGRLDLEWIRRGDPAAVMVPKASVSTLELARSAGVPVIALLETARGIAEVEQIALREEVAAIAIGTVDLAAELGLGELPGGLELLYARSRLVLACAVAGIPAIDGVHLSVADGEGLRAEARSARALGFAAKLCIHPAQLEIVREAFTPTAAELALTRSSIEAYERSLASGQGATLVGGEMVDRATVRRARRMLDSAD